MNFRNGHVQRFIDFVNWPTSRKACLYGALCAVVTYGTPWLWFQFVPDVKGRVAVELLQPLVNTWSLIFALIMLLSLPAAISGREARWVGYVLAALVSPFLVALIYLFGTMSSPLIAFYPCIIIMWALYFDERIAWFGFFNIMVWLALVGYLEWLEAIPFAPLLVDRSVDAQMHGVWFATMLMVTLVAFLFCFTLCAFVLAARRLQSAQLGQTHQALSRVNSLIRRYIPAQVVEQLSSGHEQEMVRPERRKLTIFSSDIEGFTHASDELDAEELASILDEYLSEMIVIADRHAATVSHVAGDGIIMLFGAPQATDERDHALRAVHMALDMQARMAELQEVWFRRGLERPFRTRIGISTGVVCVGDFGSEGRKLYSAVGVQANLAVRIQSFCEPGKILICQHTAKLVETAVSSVPKAEIPVKHLPAPVRVYEVRSAIT